MFDTLDPYYNLGAAPPVERLPNPMRKKTFDAHPASFLDRNLGRKRTPFADSKRHASHKLSLPLMLVHQPVPAEPQREHPHTDRRPQT